MVGFRLASEFLCLHIQQFVAQISAPCNGIFEKTSFEKQVHWQRMNN